MPKSRRVRWTGLRFAEPKWAERAPGEGDEHYARVGLRQLLVTLAPSPSERPPGRVWLLEGTFDNIRDVMAELDYVLLLVVAEAKADGWTWAEIGRALNIGRTAAQKRFGDRLAQAEKASRDELRRALAAAYHWIDWNIDSTEDPESVRQLEQAEEFLDRYGCNTAGLAPRDRLEPHRFPTS